MDKIGDTSVRIMLSVRKISMAGDGTTAINEDTIRRIIDRYRRLSFIQKGATTQ